MVTNIPAMEIASVLLAATLVWLSALVQHLTNVLKRGTGYVLSDRSIAPAMEGFFGRASRTLSNNMESGLMYIPAVLILVMLGRTSATTHAVAAVYVGARCVFSVAYWLRISPLRSLAWLTGMICCAIAVSCAALALAGR
ncbi:MAG TPA: MAPEG family protein [Povalibacter sp.]|nr:MAPEG family protein [Povalibacter sp.]